MAPRPPAATRFVVSLYATPDPALAEAAYVVPRAGHLVGGADHAVRRQHFPGHELIFCVRGRGTVTTGGGTHAAAAGDLVWVDCGHPHAYRADADDPWELYWVRTEGPGLARLAEVLGVTALPVTGRVGAAEVVPLYADAFEAMAAADPAAPARVHAAVARLVGLAFAGRASRAASTDPVCPPALLPAFQRLRLFYFEPEPVADLAARCGLSPSHFSRLFRAAFGCGPNTFRRRERVNQAKRRLAESDVPVKRVAEQVGYGDHYFFSRDFRRMVGMSPREYRGQEGRAGPHPAAHPPKAPAAPRRAGPRAGTLRPPERGG
ncbi:MAG TPA: AraC family transcriptional regulator [Humisphaera sp.]